MCARKTLTLRLGGLDVLAEKLLGPALGTTLGVDVVAVVYVHRDATPRSRARAMPTSSISEACSIVSTPASIASRIVRRARAPPRDARRRAQPGPPRQSPPASFRDRPARGRRMRAPRRRPITFSTSAPRLPPRPCGGIPPRPAPLPCAPAVVFRFDAAGMTGPAPRRIVGRDPRPGCG